MSPETATSEPIVIVRTYTARLEELWALWTTKEGFESWWGPQGFRAEVRNLDARPGGLLHYAMTADTPEMVAAMKSLGRPAAHEAHARFGELVPFTRLVLVSTIDFLPGVAPYENRIAVDFADLDGQVRMTVTLEPMHDPEMTRMSGQGFTSQLTKLDARFEDSNPG